jgi:DNA-binding NarL/FixJ family response regulator
MITIGHAGSGAEVPVRIEPDWCDVMLLDTGLPGLEGFSLLRQIKETSPRLPVLMMADSADVAWLLRGIRAGASGVVSKEASPDEFRSAIRRVRAGHPYIAEPLAGRLVLYYQRNEHEPLDERLSPREFEVMQLLSAGLKLSEIARKLNLSHQTITTHRRHILEKTGLRTTAEIIRYGVLHGLGSPEETPELN